MTDNLPVPVGTGRYVATVRPLKSGGRSDVELVAAPGVEAFADDFVARLRLFFADMDTEARSHAGDPVALTHALARLEALLADVRYVRDTVKRLGAEALKDAKVRRLTISDVATVEATSSVNRTEWRHAALLHAVIKHEWPEGLIDHATGVVLTVDDTVRVVLDYLTPTWKLTPLRDAGLNPDDFCTVATDDDGKPIATPDVRMVDNLIRRNA